MNAADNIVHTQTSGPDVSRSGVDILRIRVICNSLDSLVGTVRPVLADGERDGLCHFLGTEISQIYRRIEAAYSARLAASAEDAKIKLKLLKEDHDRLTKLATAAARCVEAMTGDRQRMSETPQDGDRSAPIRQFLAAQRHQLLWYKVHIE